MFCLWYQGLQGSSCSEKAHDHSQIFTSVSNCEHLKKKKIIFDPQLDDLC